MTPNIDSLASLARDSGVCADTRLTETELQRQSEYARVERVAYCADCGHRVPMGCEHMPMEGC